MIVPFSNAKRLPLYEGVDWNVKSVQSNCFIFVSLFTREWIEIRHAVHQLMQSIVSLFTREWIEIFAINAIQTPSLTSPSLRGSGLKSRQPIPSACTPRLPLYEGVDWNFTQKFVFFFKQPSPSLRGSGLKSNMSTASQFDNVRLPLYEGVDWNFLVVKLWDKKRLSPSLRGSGLKYTQLHQIRIRQPVSLFTREWIEISSFCLPSLRASVSLFTREWIEIARGQRLQTYWQSPSLRGSGLKCICLRLFNKRNTSPSLRGSGLKLANVGAARIAVRCLPLYEGVDWNSVFTAQIDSCNVSLFTREWIEIACSVRSSSWSNVSLFTREWIEIPHCPVKCFCWRVSLFTREWIEISTCRRLSDCRMSSPSLRGSGLKLQGLFVFHHRWPRLPLYEGVDWNIGFARTASAPAGSLPLYEGVDWNRGEIVAW